MAVDIEQNQPIYKFLKLFFLFTIYCDSKNKIDSSDNYTSKRKKDFFY